MKTKSVNIITHNAETSKALNRLCREEMKHRLLADILADLSICELEGYDKREYIQELVDMLNGFLT